MNGDNKYTAYDICKMIEFLVDNKMLGLRQTVGIPIGINFASLLAVLILYSYEIEFSDKLVEGGKRKLARKLNLSYRYIAGLISFSSKGFKEFISDIYPKELTISETKESIGCPQNVSLFDLTYVGHNCT